LVFRHFNDFIGAESTRALVEISQLLPAGDFKLLKYIIIDFRSVSSATLYDTDRALHTILHSRLPVIPENPLLVRLYDRDNPATKTLIERVTRTHDIIKRDIKSKIRDLTLYNEHEIDAFLEDLPPAETFLGDDQNWLAPP